MKYTNCKVKSIKADIVNGEITIALAVDMSQLEEAERLRIYGEKDAGHVDLEVYPHQAPLFDDPPQATHDPQEGL